MGLENIILGTRMVPPGSNLNEAQKNNLYRLQLEKGYLIPPSSHNSNALLFLQQLPPLVKGHPIQKQLSKLTVSQISLLSMEVVQYYQGQDRRAPIHFSNFSLRDYRELDIYIESKYLERINEYLKNPHNTRQQKYLFKQDLLEFISKEEYIIKIDNRDLRIQWYGKHNKLPYYSMEDFMEVVKKYYQNSIIQSSDISYIVQLDFIKHNNNKRVRNFLITHKNILGRTWVNGILRHSLKTTDCSSINKVKKDLSYIDSIKKINHLQSHLNLNQRQLPNIYEIHSKGKSFVDKNKLASVSQGSDLVIAYLKGALKINIIQQKLGGAGVKFSGGILNKVNLALPTYPNYRLFPKGSIIYKGEEYVIGEVQNQHYTFIQYGTHIKYGNWHNTIEKTTKLSKGILYTPFQEVVGILLENGNYIHLDSLPISESLIEDPSYFDTLYDILCNKYKDYLKLSHLEDKNAKYEVDLGTMNLKEFFVELLTDNYPTI